jgi:AraC-like DNA-binding protein
MFHFTTDSFPECDRFPAFCEEMFRRMLALDVARHEPNMFHGSIDARLVGNVEIAKVITSSADYFRTRDLVRDGRDDLYVAIPRNGTVFNTQCEDGKPIAVGAGVICDSTQIGGLSLKTDGSYWALKIPRSEITHRISRDGRLGGSLLDADEAALRLLTGYLENTADLELDGSYAAARVFGDHLVDLVALALDPVKNSRELIGQRGLRAARRAAIFQEMNVRLGDIQLTAVKVASALQITARYVHLLLDETGRTFSEHLLERRLNQAIRYLRDSERDHRKISEIALDSGFGDLSYFNRTFRRRFGITPSDARNADRN